MHLSPAYGRDYKSKAAIIADLKAGKDFILYAADRPVPINLPQIDGYEFPLQVRYSGLRKVCIVKRDEVVA